MAQPEAELPRVEVRGRIPAYVLAAVVVATAVKLALAARTYGTNDIRAFWFFLQEYRGSGAKLLYERDSEFNHPPFILHWLSGIRWLWIATGLRPWFLIRMPSILADVGSLFLVARLVGPALAEPERRFTLLLVAAAPVSIVVSGFHGNNDPVMIFFLLLSLVLLERPAPDWLAGAAMGMAINIKVVPLAFCPAVFLWLPSWRRRCEFFGAALLTVVLASIPWVFQEPGLLARKVLGYPSSYGVWGLSRFLDSSPSLQPLSNFFRSQGRLLLAAILIALSFWMNRSREKIPLFRQIGVLAFAFLALSPGFGVQYLAWLVPWIACFGAGLGAWAAATWTFTSGAFLFLVYTYWCQGVPVEQGDANWLGANFWTRGLPWKFADADLIGAWWGRIVPLEIACWASVVLVLVVELRGVAASCRIPEPE
jgi:hypothetical protein